jgi:hypothetical protein
MNLFSFRSDGENWWIVAATHVAYKK